MIPSGASYARAMAKCSSRSASWALKCILTLFPYITYLIIFVYIIYIYISQCYVFFFYYT